MKRLLETQRVFNFSLSLLAVLARRKGLKRLTQAMTYGFAQLNIFLNKPEPAHNTQELVEAWQAMMPVDGQEYFPITEVSLDTAYTEIHLHCPLRGNAPLNNRQAQTGEENVSILIAEDNIDMCNYLNLILKDRYTLHFVHDGEAAIEYLQETKPSLIMTDWMMPNKDGLELVADLKSNPETKHIPTLMLTARSLYSDQVRLLRAGIDDYLLKPFEDEELFNRLDNLLENQPEKEIAVVNTVNGSSNLTPKDETEHNQDWLLELETAVQPVLNDFDLTVEKVADLMKIQPWQLKEKVQKLTGFTTGKYIRELRLWEARRMLETNEYDSVKAVSYSVGFRDTKYFARKFKSRFGKNPSEFLVK